MKKLWAQEAAGIAVWQRTQINDIVNGETNQQSEINLQSHEALKRLHAPPCDRCYTMPEHSRTSFSLDVPLGIIILSQAAANVKWGYAKTSSITE